MSDRRLRRLLCLWLIIVGAVGTALVLGGAVSGDATAAFPLSLGGGILGLCIMARSRTKAGD